MENGQKTQMSYFLLTGAGFSRNWGGWLAEEAFEFLLGEVEHDDDLRKYLWKSRDERLGFEAALAQLQARYETKFDGQVEQDLRNLTSAILRMFAAMGREFHSGQIEFQTTHVQRTVSLFLSQFDALFTLNQDTLLEDRYFRSVTDRFVDCYTPGLKDTEYLLTIGMTADPYFRLKTPDSDNVLALFPTFNRTSNCTDRSTGSTKTRCCSSWAAANRKHRQASSPEMVSRHVLAQHLRSRR